MLSFGVWGDRRRLSVRAVRPIQPLVVEVRVVNGPLVDGEIPAAVLVYERADVRLLGGDLDGPRVGGVVRAHDDATAVLVRSSFEPVRVPVFGGDRAEPERLRSHVPGGDGRGPLAVRCVRHSPEL